MINNQVIKVLDLRHGKKVIEYWEGKGANIDGWRGSATEQDGFSAIYYGFINGNFNNYDYGSVLKANAEIIELPKENQYPKVMWVWDIGDSESDKHKRVVFMEKCGKYLTWNDAETIEASLIVYGVHHWDHAEDIQEEVIIELTLEDISAGKGVGVPVHLLRIKK